MTIDKKKAPFKTQEDLDRILTLDEYQFLNHPQLENLMFVSFGGSNAYGTNNENSDIDIRGIAAPLPRDILSNPELESRKNKDPRCIFHSSGFEQFNDDATDSIIYGLDKSFKLMYKCNPNTIEMLGCKFYSRVSPAGQLLLDNKNLFLSKMAVDSFSGYARQQFYRLKNALARDSMSLTEKQFYMIDVVNRMYSHLEDVYPSFSRDYLHFYVTDKDGTPLIINNDFVCLDDLVFVYKGKNVELLKAKDHNLDISNTELRVDIKAEKLKVNDLSGVFNEIHSVIADFSTHIGHRNQKKDEYHLNKHAMHLVRLYLMCFDILEKHEINTFRGDDLPLLLDVLNGKYLMPNGTYSSVFYRMIDDFDAKLKELAISSTLPDRPDTEKINSLNMDIKLQVLKENNLL